MRVVTSLFVVKSFCSPKNQITAFALVTVAACGGDYGGLFGDDGSETGPAEALLTPGLIVECSPGAEDPQRVCMRIEDFNCPLQDDYTREALCALAWGGTPADYDDQPKLVPWKPAAVTTTGQSEDAEGYVDCSDFNSYDEDVGVRNVWGQVGSNFPEPWNICSSCTICGIQKGPRLGFPTPPAWTELDLTNDCPYNQFPQFCEEPSPTTGATDEGGNESGNTGEPEDVVWVCNGSNTLSGELTWPGETEPFEKELSDMATNICVWSEPDNIPAARQACNDLCEDLNVEVAGMGTWNPPYECSSFGDAQTNEAPGFTPAPVPEGMPVSSYCSVLPNEDSMLFVGDANLDIFTGTSSAPTANVSSRGWVGLLDFSLVGSCSNTAAACNVQLTEIYAVGMDISAVYNDGVSSSPVTVADPHIRLLQPVEGLWFPSSGNLLFPNEDFFLSLSAGPTQVGTMQVSPGFNDAVMFVNQPTGYFDGGRVMLSLEWNMASVSLTVDLATQ